MFESTVSYKIPVLWNFVRSNRACKLLTGKGAWDAPPINSIEVTEKSFVILFLRNAFIGDVQISEIKVYFSFKFLKFADRNILVKYRLTHLINRNQ